MMNLILKIPDKEVPFYAILGSSSTTATIVTALSDPSPNTTVTSEASATVVSSSTNHYKHLKRPTTLALRSKSVPRNPKCSFLSANKCLYHGHKGGGSSAAGNNGISDRNKSNIFVRLTSLRKDRSGVITAVALKATVTRSDSCDLQADKRHMDAQEEVALASVAAAKVSKKDTVKMPTPVANNHATATALAAGNNNIDLYDDDESLAEEYVSTLKLNVLIGLVVLLVVSAVGTAMLLSISKIWGNHQDNVWMDDSGSPVSMPQNYLDAMSRDHDRFLHPKDLSSFLFQYEVARKRKKLEKFKNTKQLQNMTRVEESP